MEEFMVHQDAKKLVNLSPFFTEALESRAAWVESGLRKFLSSFSAYHDGIFDWDGRDVEDWGAILTPSFLVAQVSALCPIVFVRDVDFEKSVKFYFSQRVTYFPVKDFGDPTYEIDENIFLDVFGRLPSDKGLPESSFSIDDLWFHTI